MNEFTTENDVKKASENHNIKTMNECVGKLQFEHQEMVTSAEDLDHDIDCSRTKQKLFEEQIEDLKAQIDLMEETVSRGILHLKGLKDQWTDATTEALNIEEQLVKLTRTGRQPMNKSRKKMREIKKDKSFESDSEDNDTHGGISIPEDDSTKGKGTEEETASSAQTNPAWQEQQQRVKEHQLSVLMEEESAYFEESEWNSDNEYEDTLAEGKRASKNRKSKKQAAMDERAMRRQRKQAAQSGACCGSGSNKGCAIF